MNIPTGPSRTSAGSDSSVLGGRFSDAFVAARSAAKRRTEATKRAVMNAELYMIELMAITSRRPPNTERLLEILAQEHEDRAQIHPAHKRRAGRAA